MKIVAIIQARMESTRLPGKVLKEICGKPALWHIVNRASKSKYLEQIIIATSNNEADDAIEKFAKENGIDVFRGSQTNVLERFYQCAVQCGADIIVRLTGDNTLIDPHIIDLGIECFNEEAESDYISYRGKLPLGMVTEIFSFQALKTAYEEAVDEECLEHVTPYIYKNNKFRVKKVSGIGEDYSYLRWTLDTKQDYQLITKIYETLYRAEENIFSYEDIIEQYKHHKEWNDINNHIEQKGIIYKGEVRDNGI